MMMVPGTNPIIQLISNPSTVLISLAPPHCARLRDQVPIRWVEAADRMNLLRTRFVSYMWASIDKEPCSIARKFDMSKKRTVRFGCRGARFVDLDGWEVT